LQNSKQGHLILNAQDENNQQQAMLSIKQLPIKILHDLGLIESIMPGNINIDIQANAEHLQLQTASTLIQLESGAKNACQHKSCPQPQWFDFQKGEIKANYRHGDFESHYTLQINPLNKLHGQLAIKNFLL